LLIDSYVAGQLFSDPVSQQYVEEEEAPSNLSDDDDDVRITDNTRTATNMPVPDFLKKPDKNTTAQTSKKPKGN